MPRFVQPIPWAGYHSLEKVYNRDAALKSYLWAFGL